MKIRIDHNSPTPLHYQVESLLRALIDSSEYKGGKLLPNEVDLAKQLGISRTTLRQAINKLVYEELLIRKKGIGTWVNESRPISSKSKNWLSFSQEMAARGIPIRNFELHISWVIPDDQVVKFFSIKSNTKVLKLVRLRGTNDGPIVYFESFFHPSIGLTGDEDFKKPLYEMLEENFSIISYKSQEEISAKSATKFIAEKLEIDEGYPVLFRKRFVYDKDDKPIEFNTGYYKSDSFTYTVESIREL